jgi:hypothetical protein
MQENGNSLSNGFAPDAIARVVSDAAEQSHAYFEKSLRAMQSEALELMNRRLDHNGTAIGEYQSCKDFADLMTAQHKWFVDLNRDYYDTWLRFSEATHRIMTDGLSRTEEEAETLHQAARDEQRQAAE